VDKDAYTKMADVEGRHWWFVARRKIIRKIIESLGLPRDAKILEVGCGTGGNLELLSWFGEVTAVEVDAEARRIAKERCVGRVVAGQLPDGLDLGGQKFDLIVLLDVLEHINDDVGSLVALKKSLKKEGKILITVPAWPFLWSEHDEFHHHVRRYRSGEIRSKLGKAGYELRYSGYYNTLLFPVVVAVRIKNKILRRGSAGDDLDVPCNLLNKLIEKIFSAERFFLPGAKFPIGISIIAIADNEE